MKRKNVLDGKYFLTTEKLTAFSKDDPREKHTFGQILGEAAEGWFLADLFDTDLEPVRQTLMRIEQLKDAEFYVEIGELGNKVQRIENGRLSRLPAISKQLK